jgi:hypothetical protein
MRGVLCVVLAAFALCGCGNHDSSSKDKELDVQIAQAKARQAEAEAKKAAIEAAVGQQAQSSAPSSATQKSRRNDDDAAGLVVKKYAYEAFGEWSQAHPDKACPDKLEDLAQYMDTRDINDPWGHPYRMFCGQNLPAGAKGGLAVMSSGPDGREGTDDDIKSW